MVEPRNSELVLAQNLYAYIQDATKGEVRIYVGPFKQSLAPTDIPVVFREGRFQPVELSHAVTPIVSAPEGSYIVLENPSVDGKFPHQGTNNASDLQVGRKVIIAGPTTFAPWPGQVARVIQGHQLRSNEYAIVRIYNAEEAKANWASVEEGTGTDAKVEDAATGQLLIIKGTECPFFIPKDGFEVVPEGGNYVRQALTLERLEYCILLDENGNKRYERGPKVVFPTATEKFVPKKTTDGRDSTKHKAVELNPQMGLYIKVIADYKEGDKTYLTGDELFLTGDKQKIYYPREEHALIEYGSDDGYGRRQRYYAIAIPTGEARYVLDKTTGVVFKQAGPSVFLPDPRTQVIVRRILDTKAVELWYPGNEEAKRYNDSVRSLTGTALGYVQDTAYKAAVDMRTRSLNRQTKGSGGLAATDVAVAGAASAGTPTAYYTAQSVAPPPLANLNYATPTVPRGETLERGTKFTPPPTVTLDTKYEGVPTISVWTGYAVQVVNKSGARRVVKGPATILLEYDETLEMISLSTGKPKNSDNPYHTVYLRTDNNYVSDIVTVETKDMVTVNVKVSYRVNFVGDETKWFATENYVKLLTDHMRSRLRADVKKKTIKEFMDTSTEIIRDSVLGTKSSPTVLPHGERPQPAQRQNTTFTENNMTVYDVEVLETVITDQNISNLLLKAQRDTVTNTLVMAAKEAELQQTTRTSEIERKLTEVAAQTQISQLNEQAKVGARQFELDLLEVEGDLTKQNKQMEGQQALEAIRTKIAEMEVARARESDKQALETEQAETKMFIDKFAVIDPKLVEAIHTLSQNGLLKEVAQAIAPFAAIEQGGVGRALEQIFGGTDLMKRLNGSPLSKVKELEPAKK